MTNTRFRLVLKLKTWILRTVSKHMRLSEPTTKIWIKINPHYQQQRCSPITLDSGNIRFMRICGYSRGFTGERASNDSGVIEHVDFQGFWTLRLRHLRKWGQHYYMVLFSPLSPFRWHQNPWPWVTVNGLKCHFTLYVRYYERPLTNYVLLIFGRLFITLTWSLSQEACYILNGYLLEWYVISHFRLFKLPY